MAEHDQKTTQQAVPPETTAGGEKDREVGASTNAKDHDQGIVKQDNKPAEIVKEVEKDKRGRPTVMTPEVLQKLEVGYMYAYTDKEACLYAGIAVETLYKYQREHPDFIQRKRELQLTPNLQAKKVLVEDIKDNPSGARYWAERKMRDEFQPSAKVEHTGNVVMTDQGANPEIERAEEELARKYEDELGQMIGKKKVEELPEVVEKNDGQGQGDLGVVGSEAGGDGTSESN